MTSGKFINKNKKYEFRKRLRKSCHNTAGY